MKDVIYILKDLATCYTGAHYLKLIQTEENAMLADMAEINLNLQHVLMSFFLNSRGYCHYEFSARTYTYCLSAECNNHFLSITIK